MTKENLIARKFKTYKDGKDHEVYFYVSAIVKAYPDCEIQEADVKTFEINNKQVRCIQLKNVKF